MALHGPIGVTVSDGTNKVIGYWAARRTVDLEDHDQLSVYECEVRVGDDEPKRFEVEHRYSEGAISLMAKVFAKATPMTFKLSSSSQPWEKRTMEKNGDDDD